MQKFMSVWPLIQRISLPSVILCIGRKYSVASGALCFFYDIITMLTNQTGLNHSIVSNVNIEVSQKYLGFVSFELFAEYHLFPPWISVTEHLCLCRTQTL